MGGDKIQFSYTLLTHYKIYCVKSMSYRDVIIEWE